MTGTDSAGSRDGAGKGGRRKRKPHGGCLFWVGCLFFVILLLAAAIFFFGYGFWLIQDFFQEKTWPDDDSRKIMTRLTAPVPLPPIALARLQIERPGSENPGPVRLSAAVS